MKSLPSLTRDELDDLGFGSLGVDEVEHCTFSLPDGVTLAMRVWGPRGSLGGLEGTTRQLVAGPEGEQGAKYPTVLEYLPYRKADWTSSRDHRRHPWLASHGYVVVRADMRGAGDSGGRYHDEYTLEEQQDAISLIEWISKQIWSNEKVGMYGKSWGGFNGLQVAFHQPPALAAIISLFSTDNRFTDDIHWKGGCILGGGMLSWAATMFCWDARPPHPRYNAKWKEVWQDRVEHAGECLVKTWLEHPTYDSYWRHGSVIEDINKVNIPVLSIGGWHDGYTNANLRMSSSLPSCRAIIGPWSHNWPDEAVPGPNINFMGECLGWWDQHLKGQEMGVMDKPKVRWFLCQGTMPPAPSVKCWPGQWFEGDEIEGKEKMVLNLSNNHLLTCDTKNSSTGMDPVSVSFSGNAGLFCGEWLSFGAPDLPADQRFCSLFQNCWTSSPLVKNQKIFGCPIVDLEVSVDAEQGQVYAALCHLQKGGGARLLSYGLINLAAETPERRLVPGRKYKIKLQLDTIGYEIPAGEKLQLMISPGSWPTSWPSPTPTTITITQGHLTLPIFTGGKEAIMDPQPKLGPPIQIEIRREETFDRKVEIGLSDNSRTLTTRSDSGIKYYPGVDTEVDEVDEDKYIIKGDDPTTAMAVSSRTSKITYQARSGSPIETSTATVSWMTCDQNSFYLTNTLTTKLDGKDFFTRTWNETVPRNGV